MDKDTTQAKFYEHYLSFILPEGMLDFFELVWMETESLTTRESKKDIAYTGILQVSDLPFFMFRLCKIFG